MPPPLSLQWSFKEPEGMVTVLNGDIYFSPNSRRALKSIPALPQPWKFTVKVSTAAEFQEARWWTAGTEWLGFVPRIPVPYTGVWFGTLSIIPNKLLCENQVEYGLPPFYRDKWLEIDYMLWETCKILRDSYQLKYALPFPPRRWDYHKMFPSWSSAMEHITKGRDWFAMWIGLLYWSARKIPNGSEFSEGLTTPDWFREIVRKRSSKINGTYIDAIRTSQLLQNWWQIDRVGLFLHHPDDAPCQQSAQWFVDQSVPVWYRWGVREDRSSSVEGFPLIKPPAEYLQNVTTWISPSPSSYQAQPSFCEYTDDAPMEENRFSMPPMPLQSSSGQMIDSPTASTSHLPPTLTSATVNPSDDSSPKQQVRNRINKYGFPASDYGSGRPVWEPFFKKQEERHKIRLQKENPKAKQARLSRMRQPPKTSCPVYVWDWNDDEPPLFVRTLVRKDERCETLDSYSGEQKKYNSFDNEWDCCQEWGEDPDEDDLVEPLPPHLEPQKTLDEVMAERFGTEVSRLLYEYYGWVVPLPLPLPESHASWLPEENRKSLKAVLGIDSAPLDSPFFCTPLAKAAMGYVRVLASKEAVRPSDEVWDLVEENRLNLAYCHTLNNIRTLKRGDETWYMFDLEKCGTVPWKIAVPTAASALMVCRLKETLYDASKDRLDESAVVQQLVLEGVRFHTVRHRDELGEADAEEPSPTYVPMRLSDHIFTEKDVAFYQKQCREVMSSPRARAAILRGGFVRRIALQFMNASEALRGPCGTYPNSEHMFVAKDVNGVEYVDDELSNEEYDMLSGVYTKFTGDHLHTAKVSWYPQCWVFEGSGLDLGRWSDHAERFWDKRTHAMLNNEVDSNLRFPLNVTQWRSKLRGLADARRAWSKVEKWSETFLLERIGSI